ncbi:MAG: dihydrofolate reductase [Planctomycetota bacterium]|nr:dihydrofolate reductase [Planctomycetota bacterium]
MRITLIAAASDNNIIGRDGALPWRLPADMAFFKNTTMGHPVIMGRRTWETLPKPLDGRKNIVLTRQANLVADGASVVGSTEAAMEACESADECFVIGGGEIYRLFIDRADRILLTRVHVSLSGDAEFPPLDGNVWVLSASEQRPADDRNEHAMTFEDWQRH